MSTRGEINLDEIKKLDDAKSLIISLDNEAARLEDMKDRFKSEKDGAEKVFQRLKEAVFEAAREHDLRTHEPGHTYQGIVDGQEKSPFDVVISLAKEITELRTENDIFAQFKDIVLKRSEIKIQPEELNDHEH